MRQFKIIFKHELKEYLKSKAFLAITGILVAVILVVMFWPRFTGKGEEQGAGADALPKIGVSAGDGVDVELAKTIMSSDPEFAGYEIVTKDSLDTLKAEVTGGKIDSGYAITDLKSYTYVVLNASMTDDGQSRLQSVMEKLNLASVMKEKGIADAEISAASAVQITASTEALGSDQKSNYFYAYIMIFALYMIIVLYGSMVATSVASEKSSRAMEVLITSARPTALMFGKILAACVAGMGQLVLIFGSAFAGYQANASYWSDNFLIGSIFNIPLDMVLYMLLFFLLGFLLYAMLYGAVGSMATKVEDVSTLQTPIMFLFIAGFFIVTANMGSNVNNIVMVIASYFPFTSPMAMFTRIVMGDIAVYEIIISVAILIASVAACGVFAARIYRAGVLHYGKTPKFSEILSKAKKESV